MALVVATNSYISRADADTYFSDSIRFSSWDAIAYETKDRALITASRQISIYVIDEYKLGTVLEGDIPASLANASAEYALDIALDPNVATQSNTGSNTKKLKAGSAEIEYFSPTYATSGRFPQYITEMIRDCLGSGISSVVAPFASGTDETSSFTNQNKNGYSEGL